MNTRPAAAILVALAVFVSACAEPSVKAPPSQAVVSATPVSAIADDNPQLRQLTTIERQTIEARGLKERQPIEKRLIGRDEASQFIATELESDRTEIDRRGTVYKLLDLIPQATDLVGLQRDLLSSQVQGFYDPRTKALNVITTATELNNSDEITLAHEIVHALQDQHFDLQQLHKASQDDWDRDDAYSSLIEGDATALMVAYAVRYRKLSLTDAASLAQSQSLNQFPPALQRELQFPYIAGMAFVDSLTGGSNWPAVNAAFNNPPKTTEQVLHPEKYKAAEGPKAVRLPDLSPRLGTGWRRITSNTLGEFRLRNYLALELDRDTIAAAATGWGGDGWVLYSSDGGQNVLYMMLAWDTDTDRNEFLAAYRQWLGKRGGTLQAQADGGLRWQRDGKSIAVDQRSDATRVIIASSPGSLDLALRAD
jgi:hypothetical protein